MPRHATGRDAAVYGPPRPGPLLNRPRGDKCSKQGKPSQANRGPKNLGRSLPVSAFNRLTASRDIPPRCGRGWHFIVKETVKTRLSRSSWRLES